MFPASHVTNGVRAATSWFLRWIALVMLALAVVPAAQGALEQLVCEAAGVECCEGGCDDDAPESCPQSCLHCACCAHASALPAGVVWTLEAEAPLRRLPFGRVRGAEVPGYRAPPFRPPLA